jgi:hypothetical protein
MIPLSVGQESACRMLCGVGCCECVLSVSGDDSQHVAGEHMSASVRPICGANTHPIPAGAELRRIRHGRATVRNKTL